MGMLWSGDAKRWHRVEKLTARGKACSALQAIGPRESCKVVGLGRSLAAQGCNRWAKRSWVSKPSLRWLRLVRNEAQHALASSFGSRHCKPSSVGAATGGLRRRDKSSKQQACWFRLRARGQGLENIRLTGSGPMCMWQTQQRLQACWSGLGALGPWKTLPMPKVWLSVHVQQGPRVAIVSPSAARRGLAAAQSACHGASDGGMWSHDSVVKNPRFFFTILGLKKP